VFNEVSVWLLCNSVFSLSGLSEIFPIRSTVVCSVKSILIISVYMLKVSFIIFFIFFLGFCSHMCDDIRVFCPLLVLTASCVWPRLDFIVMILFKFC
jgi:hypothetical protein